MISGRRVGSVGVLVAFVSVVAWGQSSADLLTRAKGLMERKQYSLALETLSKLLETDPGNQAALKMKDDALRLSGEAEAAGKVEQMLAEAQTYLQAHQEARALKRLKEILAVRPDHKEAQALVSKIELESEMALLESESEASAVKEGDFVAVDQLDTPPQITKLVPPIYPDIARRMGIEGEARVLATVGVDGAVEKVDFLRRIEGWDDLNDAAMKAVRRYKFSPGMKGGVKVKTIVNLSVAFRLNQEIQAPHMR